ncbi:DUF389 domain-containing protein [Microbulbifer salipaludis]|uniref:DUF389 domain-containing protein n=1 Tax=Microbulbifer salipaludis TaxID=187980 RepID=A0ABS3E9Z6_9GAMM|nr:DUF389 domain-containing protein [Microbulbifer salipaludis]MBN8432128.1 DUF389 domain-containing protein [Microbulbifer salipaludis]
MAGTETKPQSDWRRYIEKPLPRPQAREQILPGSIPSPSFYLMMTASTVIATLGLLADSAAVIIGAMLIAPLMAPIISLAFGAVSWDGQLVLRSALIAGSGSLLCILIAFLTTYSIGYQMAGPEIVARMRPSMLDLGVAIAAGAAAAYTLTRPNTSATLAGIAIAVALVPPLCTVGIALALDNEASIEVGVAWDSLSAKRPFILFLTNLVGIAFAATVVFFLQYFRRQPRGIGAMAIAFTCLLVVVPSLTHGLQELLVRNKVQRSLIDESEKIIGADQEIRFTSITTRFDGESIVIRVEVIDGAKVVTQEFSNELQQRMRALVEMPVQLEIGVIPERIYRGLDTARLPSRSPPPATTTDAQNE